MGKGGKGVSTYKCFFFFFGLIQKHFPDILARVVRWRQAIGYFKPSLHAVVKPSPEFGFAKPLALEIFLGA